MVIESHTKDITAKAGHPVEIAISIDDKNRTPNLFMKNSDYKLPAIRSKQWIAITGSVLALIINISLLSIIFVRNQGYSHIDFLTIILGWVVGWALGTFFSPINDDDKNRLTVIGQTVSAFFTGFIVSKLDRYIEMTLFQGKDFQAENWKRLGLFIAATISVSLTVFVIRSYWVEAERVTELLRNPNLGAATSTETTSTATPLTGTKNQTDG